MAPIVTKVLVVLCGLWLSMVAATEIENISSALFARQEVAIDCKTERSGDYYGFGVRLGIYFSWWGAFLANTMKPDEIEGQLDTNAIFMFALLVAMVRCSITKMLQILDGLMLMHLSGATIFGVLSIWGYRTCYYLSKYEGIQGIKHFGGIGTHSRILLALGVSAYGLWFWLYGVTGGLITGEGPCEEVYTFFFAKLNVTGGIRGYYIWICVSCLIYFSIMLVVSGIAIYARIRRFIFLSKSKQWENTTMLRFATGLTQRELRRFHLVMRWFSGIWLIFSMITIEMTLNINHVMSVLGKDGEAALPSQLIPLLIGAISFTRILYLKFLDWRSEHDAVPPSVDTNNNNTDDPYKPAQTSSGGAATYMASGSGTEKFTQWSLHRSKTDRSSQPTDNGDSDELDELFASSPRWKKFRLLVAWLPWLSLLMQSENERAYLENQDLMNNYQSGMVTNGTNSTLGSGNGTATAYAKPTSPYENIQVRRKPVQSELSPQHNSESPLMNTSRDSHEYRERYQEGSDTIRSVGRSTPEAPPQLPAIEFSRPDSFEKGVASAQSQPSNSAHLTAPGGNPDRAQSITERAQSIARKFGKSGISYERP